MPKRMDSSAFPIAWNNLGNSLRMLGDVEEAEECFEQALQQQPDYLYVTLHGRPVQWRHPISGFSIDF